MPNPILKYTHVIAFIIVIKLHSWCLNCLHQRLVPGSSFGLSLVLNIEQYEYMSGANTDAGIKVYMISVIKIVYHCQI